MLTDLRPESDLQYVNWFNRQPMCIGGKIIRRSKEPNSGWYVIRGGTATGPFKHEKQAAAWAGRTAR